MTRVRAVALFWWDFIVGDDYRIAIGVIAVLAATAGLSHSGMAAWWLVPVVVLGTLAASVLHAARRARRS
jgi:hypothetical protein